MYFNLMGDVKNPVRAHETDAGIDFFVPNDVADYVVKPGETCFIPLKVRAVVPKGYVLLLKDKSGVALKKQITVMAGVVDCGYTGEIGLQIANVGNAECTIKAGEKICQGLLMPVCTDGVLVVSDSEYEEHSKFSDRGTGGYGSTGTF